EVSPYETVTAGDYSVAMRAAGAAASSQPVLSTSVTVKAGHAYTVAGMGPKSGLRLQVLNDDLTTPAGKSSVRVIQASLKEQTVKFTCGGQDIVPKATFASVSSYQAIPANTWTMQAIGSNSTATDRFNMAAGTVHTMVVLDGASGLEIVNLEDAAGAGQPPAGGVTGDVAGGHRGRRAGRCRRRPQAASSRAAPSDEHRGLRMPLRRPAAIAFAAGLVVIVGGTAGLLLTHHSTPALRPVAAGVSALPAPTSPIVAP